MRSSGYGWKPLKKTARAHAVAVVVRNGDRLIGRGLPGRRAERIRAIAQIAVRGLNCHEGQHATQKPRNRARPSFAESVHKSMINVAQKVHQRGFPGCFRIRRLGRGALRSRKTPKSPNVFEAPCSRKRSSTVESTAAARCSIVRGIPTNMTPPSPLSAKCDRTSLLFSSGERVGERRRPRDWLSMTCPRTAPILVCAFANCGRARTSRWPRQWNGAIHPVISGSGLLRTGSTACIPEAVSQQSHRLE